LRAEPRSQVRRAGARRCPDHARRLRRSDGFAPYPLRTTRPAAPRRRGRAGTGAHHGTDRHRHRRALARGDRRRDCGRDHRAAHLQCRPVAARPNRPNPSGAPVSAGILLCGGASTRFNAGGPKLLALFRGRPLVVWALEHIGAAGFDEVIVVVGAIDLAEVLTDQTVVDNRVWQSGLSSSLRAGVNEAQRRGYDSVVVGLGDQPLVPSSAWSAVQATQSPIAVANFG